jgi:hypothetical protein
MGTHSIGNIQPRRRLSTQLFFSLDFSGIWQLQESARDSKKYFAGADL